MINNLMKKIFGSSNERFIKSLQSIVSQINNLEEGLQKLSDNELKAKTQEFKARIAEGETLDKILPEAFAVVREASVRSLGMRHFDVQMVGGIVLHQGKIAEMKTGEGKTLVGTLAVYLNALSGKGVHVVTVNDYLAKRDAEWMGKLYNFLGLSVGIIEHSQSNNEKRAAYACDITYGTNNEYGFDYLRDNMKYELGQMVQREFNFAIVDEVDSILIDEARTPLIISGPTEDRTDLYVKVDKIIPKLIAEDFEIDEKQKSVTLTEVGNQHIEKLVAEDGLIVEGSNLYDMENMQIVHHVNQALKAHTIFKKDIDYLVIENKVMIIDEFTGRVLDGRRYSEGLHQALEAKENVKIQNENQTLASITFQNYFRMYPKLAGMTGTALTEANEFADIYKLEVVEIPTNVPVARIDAHDNIYRTEEEKFEAIAKLIEECNQKNQPVLAGTVSVEKSELLSKYLKKRKIKHNILNAKQHASEAVTISQAGRPAAVTVATNMAGRGTDIKLGGNADMMIEQEISALNNPTEAQIAEITARINAQVEADKKIVLEAGGLCVIGTERHESRRIDNQLRGRSGRQGDNGYSKFFLSTSDDLIRVFGADKKMDWIMGKMGEEGQPIEHPLITRLMEKSQMRVEQRNYEIRKNLLRFDDVMNEQRKVIYAQRKTIMQAQEVREKLMEYLEEEVDIQLSSAMPANSYPEQWDLDSLQLGILRVFNLNLPIKDWAAEEGIADDEMFNRIMEKVEGVVASRDEQFGAAVKDLEKRLLLFTLDEVWKEHLLFLDHLRQGINLRAYAQKDPLNEYKKEAFEEFQTMLEVLREKFLTRLFHTNIHADEDFGEIMQKRAAAQKTIETRNDPNFNPAEAAFVGETVDLNSALNVVVRSQVKPSDRVASDPSTWGKVGRNEACPCGSGKKFKSCHGAV
jgi:preprotein translocase subunit SecA